MTVASTPFEVLDTTTGVGDTGQAGGNKINDNFSVLPYGLNQNLPTLPTKQVCLVEQTHPTPGNTITLATLTGAGIVRGIYAVVSYGNAWKDDRIQVFCDGEALPSIDVDLATFFGTGYAATTNGLPPLRGGTQYRDTGPGTDGGGFSWNTNKCWSGTFKYPIPYSSGCVIKLLCPTGMNTTGGFGTCFSQVAYQPGTLPAALSNLRLKSYGNPNISAVHYTNTAQIVWMNKPNLAGWVVDLALAQVGDAPTGGQLSCGYLERQEWIAVDGESTTPDGKGAINTAYASSGGEDWWYRGWYFAGQAPYVSYDTTVTNVNYTDYSTCMTLSFLSRHGGVRFNNQIAMGWSLKDGPSGNGFITGFTGSYQILYYVDMTVPFAPTAPQNAAGASASSTSLLFTWNRPASDGSNFLTGYTITLSPGGATQTVAANSPTATFTGLTTSTSYTATIYATNSVGNSATTTASATPVAATAPVAPTIGTATAGNTNASVTFTPNGTGGSPILDYRVTPYIAGVPQTAQTGFASSPAAVTSLTNGTAYTFTVAARNAVGYSSESAASNAATPSATANPWDSSIDTTHFTYTNSNFTVAGGANAFWTATHSLNGKSTDGTYTADIKVDSGTVTGYVFGVGVCNGTANLTQSPTTTSFTTMWFDGSIQGSATSTGPGFTTLDTITVKLVISGGGTSRVVSYSKNGGAFSTPVTAPGGGVLYYMVSHQTSAHQATSSNVTW